MDATKTPKVHSLVTAMMKQTISIDDLAFPLLVPDQLEAMSRIAEVRRFAAGEILIPHGMKDYPFFAITSGEVRIVEQDVDGERLIATHAANNFIGDIDMLTGRSSLFVAIANTPVEVLQMCAGKLRRLLQECPDVSEMLLKAFQWRRKLLADRPFIGVRVIGTTNTSETTKLREFFYKNHVPYTFFEATEPSGMAQLEKLGAENLPLPVVRCNDHTIGNPSLLKIAECIGISRDVNQNVFDLVIVGGGPAGLAAAVYASSEGIKTLVVDSVGPGGQAASSSKIENFIGFPSGLSGGELASRGYLQALKFGTQFISPVAVEAVESGAGEHRLKLSNGQTARARCVLVATGVSYRQLDLPGCVQFEGAGVYYSATSVEARVCAGHTAVVVGGGNSAGQAAMFLASSARDVKMVIRGPDLSKGMSTYLSQRVSSHPKIEILPNSEVVDIRGSGCVQSVSIRDAQQGSTKEIECPAVFIFIGAKPHTAWLPPAILLDEKGFVLTGSSFYADRDLRSQWSLERTPCDLETTVPGILAAGDVRSGTTKRCGFAVGDGSLAISCVHRILAQF